MMLPMVKWKKTMKVKKYLTEHPDVFAEVDTAVRAKCLPNASEEEETAEEEKKAPAKKTAKKDE